MENVPLPNRLEILSANARTLDPSNNELLFLSVELDYLHDFLTRTDCLHKAPGLVTRMTEVVVDAEDAIQNYGAYSSYKNRNILERCFRHGSKKPKNDLGRNIQDLKKMTSTIREDIEKLKTEENHGVEADGSRHLKAFIPEEADVVVGFTKEVDILVDRLTSEKSEPALTAISIVGMAGIGKSTLANKIYNHDLVKKKFIHRAWFCYSDQKNTQASHLLSILKCLYELTEGRKAVREGDLGKELANYLKGKTYLIVLDNVWRNKFCDVLKSFLPDDQNGSKILLTTRFPLVSFLANTDQTEPPHYLRLLEKQDSWELFKSKAFQGKTVSHKWETLGRQIAEKCCGLPLAITYLGCSLQSEMKNVEKSETKEAMERELYFQWLKICKRVTTHLFEHSFSLELGLDIIYEKLPRYMKQCFLYLSVFPEDYEISARQLIQLWVAEGFIKEYVVSGETMEETATGYLEKLADEGFVQVMQRKMDGGVKTCCINPLYRDFCASEAQKEGYLRPGHRLVVNDGKIQDISKNLGHLQSLLCFTHMSGTSEEWSDLFQTTQSLKVLNIPNVNINLADEVGNLTLLRYLCLDKDSMPVYNLPNLQVLDARSKFLKTVPDGFWKLKKLRHAYFKGHTLLPQPPVPPQITESQPQPQLKPPAWSTLLSFSRPQPQVTPPSLQSSSSLSLSIQIGSDAHNEDETSLKDLQTLSTISVESCTKEIIRRLPNLLRLGIIVKGYLNSLSDNLVMLTKLRTFKLAGAVDLPPLVTLPLKFPPNLIKLILTETYLLEDPIPLLGELKKLEFLKVSKNAYVGPKMVFSPNGFPNLEHLKLADLVKVSEIEMGKGALPKLQRLTILDCYYLKTFAGFENLTRLRDVSLKKPSTSLSESINQFKKSLHFQLQID